MCELGSSASSSSIVSASSSEPVPGDTRAQLHVKLIQARNLNITWDDARPYAIIQCEQNEFVGGEACCLKHAKQRVDGEDAGDGEGDVDGRDSSESQNLPDAASPESKPPTGESPDCCNLRNPIWNTELSL